jgi:O-antigen ligase
LRAIPSKPPVLSTAIRWPDREAFVLRIAEVGLAVALTSAVLAFGGTAPPFFLASQLIVLTLGVVLLAIRPALLHGPVHLPVMTPLVLVALVLLQLLPFPAASTLPSTAQSAVRGSTTFTLSIAPYKTTSHLLLLVTYLVAFYIVILICQDQQAKKRLVYVLLAVGTFEAFYGLLEYITGWQQIFAYVKQYYVADATGTYINRNHFAGLLEMVLPFAVGLALGQAGVLRGASRSSELRARELLSASQLPKLILWCFVAAIILAALIFSRSRMGIMAALISLLALLILARGSSLSRRPRSAVAAVFLLGAIGLVIWIGSDAVVARFETLGQEASPVGENRLSIWRDTLKLIHQHPVIGTGLGTFSVAYPSVQTVFLSFVVEHAHCDYLEVVSELGLPGGILLFASILWIVVRAAQRYSKIRGSFDLSVCLGCVGSITAILVHSLTDFNLYIPANALVFVVIAGLAWSTAHLNGASRLRTLAELLKRQSRIYLSARSVPLGGS